MKIWTSKNDLLALKCSRSSAYLYLFTALLLVVPRDVEPFDRYVLSFSTYLGGSEQDQIRDITTDAEGNVFVTGGTASPNFPVTPGAYQTTHNPGDSVLRRAWRKLFSSMVAMDVFVTKLDGDGNIVWSTFIGGPNYDRAYAVEVDDKGFVYVAGRAGAGFPVTPGVFQTTFMGGEEASFYGPQDGFVAKLTPDGRKLVWASYFGSSDPQIIRDLDIDRNGEVYVVSGFEPSLAKTFPPGWSTWFDKGFQRTPRGGKDTVVAKIASDGSKVFWATYLGGSSDESVAPTVRVDADGYPVVFTNTHSADMPTTAEAYDRTHNGGIDAYVAKLTKDGTVLVYGTYLGGSGDDSPGGAHGGAVDSKGNVYVSGYTFSRDFPVTAGAVRTTGGKRGAVPDSFTSKLSSDGSRLLASTYFGAGEGVVVDFLENVYFSTGTIFGDYPVTDNAFQKRRKGVEDAVVAKLAADFTKFLYATYMGGTNASRHNESFRAIAIDSKGNIYVAGTSESMDWPTLNAFQSSHSGNWDGVLAKFTFMGRPPNPSRISLDGVLRSSSAVVYNGQTVAAETQVYSAAGHDSNLSDGCQCSLRGNHPDLATRPVLDDVRVLREP